MNRITRKRALTIALQEVRCSTELEEFRDELLKQNTDVIIGHDENGKFYFMPRFIVNCCDNSCPLTNYYLEGGVVKETEKLFSNEVAASGMSFAEALRNRK